MKKTLQGFLWLALLCILSGQMQSAEPIAVQTGSMIQTLPVQPTLADRLPVHRFTAEKPALPYLRISHYVNGEYVRGYIALTDEEVDRASRQTANVDVADVIEICTASNPKGSYGLMPPLYAELAAEYAGFTIQSPAEIGEVVSATMTVTLFGEKRSQTVTDTADLSKLRTILRGAKQIQRTGCPWTDALVLTMADGSDMTVRIAADSCRTMLFGTGFCYQISNEDNEWMRTLFHETASK